MVETFIDCRAATNVLFKSVHADKRPVWLGRQDEFLHDPLILLPEVVRHAFKATQDLYTRRLELNARQNMTRQTVESVLRSIWINDMKNFFWKTIWSNAIQLNSKPQSEDHEAGQSRQQSDARLRCSWTLVKPFEIWNTPDCQKHFHNVQSQHKS